MQPKFHLRIRRGNTQSLTAVHPWEPGCGCAQQSSATPARHNFPQTAPVSRGTCHIRISCSLRFLEQRNSANQRSAVHQGGSSNHHLSPWCPGMTMDVLRHGGKYLLRRVHNPASQYEDFGVIGMDHRNCTRGPYFDTSIADRQSTSVALGCDLEQTLKADTWQRRQWALLK